MCDKLPQTDAFSKFIKVEITIEHTGPVVQSVVSLTSSLVVKMLTVLLSTISNSQVFFWKKMWVASAFAKATHIFSTKILAYMPYLMIKDLTIRWLMTSLALNNWATIFFYHILNNKWAVTQHFLQDCMSAKRLCICEFILIWCHLVFIRDCSK